MTDGRVQHPANQERGSWLLLVHGVPNRLLIGPWSVFGEWHVLATLSNQWSPVVPSGTEIKAAG